MKSISLLPLLLACSSDPATPPATTPGTPDAGGGGSDASMFTGDPELPPTTTKEAMNQWLAAAPYKKWKCQPAKHPGAANSPHGDVRICSNAKLAGSASGDYPVGAASVKELHGAAGITGYAVSVKIAAPSAPASWYWFEVDKGAFAASGAGDMNCTNCHASAAAGTGRDFTFVQVK
jgi:hypothetical protein